MLRTLIWKILLIAGLIPAGSGFAQVNQDSDTTILTGIIWDAESFQPLPYATIYTSGNGTSSNLEGAFRIAVSLNDTIKVTYLGYEPQESVVSKNSEYLFFWLKPLTTMLTEVVIKPLPSEAKMKRAMLHTESEPPITTIKAKNNLRKIQDMYLRGYKTDMNSLDNFYNYMRGPQDVSILSTNPFRGINGVRKSLRR